MFCRVKVKVKIKLLWDYGLSVYLIAPSQPCARWYGAAPAGACNHRLSQLGRRSIRTEKSTRRPALVKFAASVRG